VNQARRGSYQATLLFLIFLVLSTLLFGVLAYMRYAETETLVKGGEEPGPTRPLVQLREEEQQLEAKIRDSEIELRDLKHTAIDLDSKLARHTLRYDTATQRFYGPDKPEWNVQGEPEPVSFKSAWTHTQENIRFNLEMLEHAEAKLKDQPNLFQPLEDNQRDFSDRLRNTMRQITEADAELEENRDRLDAKLDDLEDRREVAIEEFHTTKSELATERSRLEARIRELLELHLNWLGELRPDGTVVEVDPGHDFLIIDIGSQDRVFNGLKLEIFQYEKGHYDRKGFCEVIETRDTFATCRIVSEAEPNRDPIIKGDMVANPLFSTERAPIIVLAGEFQLYNKGDLATFLRRTGAVVQDQLGPEVDYLIAADRSAAAQDKAREYRITAMTEEQAVRFLDTSFEPED